MSTFYHGLEERLSSGRRAVDLLHLEDCLGVADIGWNNRDRVLLGLPWAVLLDGILVAWVHVQLDGTLVVLADMLVDGILVALVEGPHKSQLELCWQMDETPLAPHSVC